jgi:hypothetical protein
MAEGEGQVIAGATGPEEDGVLPALHPPTKQRKLSAINEADIDFQFRNIL